ncbi:uncharacterized protein [Primulina eburnea]|uniref:uncharacterized protein n=1 Tax=Primulina eburnea TaxID=1245227 RepID=UPI003C6C7C24
MKKMIAQLLLSLSIFSFVFSCYSLCSSSQSQPPKLPANPFMNLHHSSHAVNKNYVFLICNALLVFLSKTSGLLCSSSGFDLNDMLQKRVGDGVLLQTYNNVTKEPSFLQRPQEEDEEGERILNEETNDQISMESDEEYLRGICDDHDFEADADKIHEEDTENCSLAVDCMIVEEEEEEEDKSMDQQQVAGEDALSTEELNKKFEEFIRKTKEEIMMNEARQLIIVK